ncbi:putative thioredoxin reductase [Lachnellula suecica]|uniref:Putative thioredoxin reductase n=1 Tax=Lachnellula suecica TaxID=602035 RepID=A0A8T9CH59_9HELO|nr:putative thioredoxin reductase [Lachnellula suecica]
MGFLRNLSTFLLLLAPISEAVSIPRASIPSTDYDALVVGGGPSGLSALSGLARVRRKTLLLDSAEYRNGETRHMHDVIGNDGTVPAVFRYNARELIAKYPTAFMKNATVTSIVSVNGTNGTYFLTTDAAGETYTSRKVILATGLSDIIPDTPGVKEAWQRGIYWCPWCDGYEHRDQPFGILGSILDCVGSTMEMETLNKDIIAFVNGTYTDENVAILDKKRPGWFTQLQRYGVAIENRTIMSIERVQDGAVVHDVATDTEFDQFVVHVADGTTFNRSAFITNYPSVQHSHLGAPLGVKIYGEKMDVDPASMRTAAPGVFAVGDANSDNSTNVPHAMFTGKKAAVFLHVELEKEYAATLLSKRDESLIEERMGSELEDLWKRLSKS